MEFLLGEEGKKGLFFKIRQPYGRNTYQIQFSKLVVNEFKRINKDYGDIKVSIDGEEITFTPVTGTRKTLNAFGATKLVENTNLEANKRYYLTVESGCLLINL